MNATICRRSGRPLHRRFHFAGGAILFLALALLARPVPASAADVTFPSDFVPTHYDLSALPVYQPEHRLLGSIRIYGTPLE